MDATLEFSGASPEDMMNSLREFDDILDAEMEEAAEEIGLRVISTAARLVAVDTGRLRASIQSEVERVSDHILKVWTGSNVEYAPIQEVRQPYLRPAFQEELPFIEDRIRTAVQNANAEVS